MEVKIEGTINDYDVLGIEIRSALICSADVAASVFISSCSDPEVDLSNMYNIKTDSALNYQRLDNSTNNNFERFSFDLQSKKNS